MAETDVIGGIPLNWRDMNEDWRKYLRKYDALQPWVSTSYAADKTDFSKLGITYIAHAKPGFSWANLMYIPTGSSFAFTPRNGGEFYWKCLCDLAKAKVDRLCVGMFDEYDEATAIMPMSDDPPPTPFRPGVGLQYLSVSTHSLKATMPTVFLDFGLPFSFKGVSSQNCRLSWGGWITPPTTGKYTLSVKGVAGDSALLVINDKKVLDVKNFNSSLSNGIQIDGTAGQKMTFILMTGLAFLGQVES